MQLIALAGWLRSSGLADDITILASSCHTNTTDHDHTQLKCAIFEVHLVVLIMVLENDIMLDPVNRGNKVFRIVANYSTTVISQKT